MLPDRVSGDLTRRALLKAAGGLALAGALDLPNLARAAGPALRTPDSLPRPGVPAGTVDPSLPFDHVVIVMQENHSFDSYLGMLPRRGQPLADGLTLGADGRPVNSNPYKGGFVTVQHAPSDCTLDGSGSQSWTDTHRQIDGGKMDGFAATGVDSMVYWDEPDIPFYYSLANTFCTGDRWFCSAPCQTYPNRRFLQAGTAFGLISTDTSSVTQYPPNGTIWDRLAQYGISWTDYFVQVPTAAIIFDTVAKYPENMRPIAQFYADCAAGTLPAVSMVDSGIGGVGVLAGLINEGNPSILPAGLQPGNMDQDEESGNISEGENFVANVVNAVLRSPLWPRILLVWLYDEHGGNYDHVPPPAAIPPDNIPPNLPKGDPPGGYNIYGPRVPSVVVSGYSRPHAVTHTVHDHTSVLATIEAKWNLPALTYRDANAATLEDFLLPAGSQPSFPVPPTLAAPSNESQTQLDCDPGPLSYPVLPVRPARGTRLPAEVTLSVLESGHNGPVVVLARAVGETLHNVRLEVVHHGKRVSEKHLEVLGGRARRVALHHHGTLKPGRYAIHLYAGNRLVLTHTQALRRSEL